MDEELILETLRKTLEYVAGDYPNASTEYKRSSFAVGACDMAMMFVRHKPPLEQIPFARRVDEIRNAAFGR